MRGQNQTLRACRQRLDRAPTVLGIPVATARSAGSGGAAADTRCTHERNPSFIFGSMRMGCPAASSGALISKTCSTRAMLRNSAASAKYRPGHILRQAGRPRENVYMMHRTGARPRGAGKGQARAPSAEAKRNCRGISDVWIQLAVLEEAFREEAVWIGIVLCVMQDRPGQLGCIPGVSMSKGQKGMYGHTMRLGTSLCLRG